MLQFNNAATEHCDAAGTTRHHCVTANGAGKTYNDTVTMRANATLCAGTDIVFDDTVNNGVGGPFNLAVNTAALTTFNGEVGGRALASARQ